MTNPSQEQIRARAYELWQQAGMPEGREDEFWQQAEQALRETGQLRDIATEPAPTILPG
jgi:DUF2934 family protein